MMLINSFLLDLKDEKEDFFKSAQDEGIIHFIDTKPLRWEFRLKCKDFSKPLKS